jgi:formylmethanofuran dehydrogenase subunit B
LQQANYSVIFFGPEIGGVAEIETLFLLVRQLNAKSRSAAIGLGGTLCESVLTWQTGYPCGVNFALGYPRYDPYAYSTNTLLERGEVDAVLVIGSEGLEELSPAAQARLAKLPVILLASTGSTSSLNPAVCITTALAGVHCGGTIFRMDGVPLKLRAIRDSSLPTAASLLTAIQGGVCSSCV